MATPHQSLPKTADDSFPSRGSLWIVPPQQKSKKQSKGDSLFASKENHHTMPLYVILSEKSRCDFVVEVLLRE